MTLTAKIFAALFGIAIVLAAGRIAPADPAPDKLQWRALAAAGDDSASVFDNAVDRLSQILAARGVSPVDRFTSDPTVAKADRPLATEDSLAAALAAAPPKPGGGCFVFLTSHGGKNGLLLRDDLDHRFVLEPSAFGRMLDHGCGQAPTVAIVSGCYSGIFISRQTEAPNRIILTAARDDRTSFGCGHEQQYTYFDDCLFRAWPDSPTWVALYRSITACVREKEDKLGVRHSEPQAFFGQAVANLALP